MQTISATRGRGSPPRGSGRNANHVHPRRSGCNASPRRRRQRRPRRIAGLCSSVGLAADEGLPWAMWLMRRRWEEKSKRAFWLTVPSNLTIITLMARTFRVALGGYCYHVLNRGNGRRTVYHKYGDFSPSSSCCTKPTNMSGGIGPGRARAYGRLSSMTPTAHRLGLEATLRPFGRPRKDKTETQSPFDDYSITE
jgi:hypothetical protein